MTACDSTVSPVTDTSFIPELVKMMEPRPSAEALRDLSEEAVDCESDEEGAGDTDAAERLNAGGLLVMGVGGGGGAEEGGGGGGGRMAGGGGGVEVALRSDV